MKIGIIGAGQIGGTLAKRLTALGHEVSIANSQEPESLAKLSAETGARPVLPRDAARAGDVVIVTIQQGRIPELPKNLFDGVPKSVVVVDTGNYYPRERDGRIDGIEDGLPESRWVEQQLGRPVVKAFNNIQAMHLLNGGKPKGAQNRIALPIAGDDPAAKAVILALVEELGFDAVDAGTIKESWRQQPDSPVYGTNLDAQGVQRGLQEAPSERKPQWSATPESPGSFERPA